MKVSKNSAVSIRKQLKYLIWNITGNNLTIQQISEFKIWTLIGNSVKTKFLLRSISNLNGFWNNPNVISIINPSLLLDLQKISVLFLWIVKEKSRIITKPNYVSENHFPQLFGISELVVQSVRNGAVINNKRYKQCTSKKLYNWHILLTIDWKIAEYPWSAIKSDHTLLDFFPSGYLKNTVFKISWDSLLYRIWKLKSGHVMKPNRSHIHNSTVVSFTDF